MKIIIRVNDRYFGRTVSLTFHQYQDIKDNPDISIIVENMDTGETEMGYRDIILSTSRLERNDKGTFIVSRYR